MSIIPDDALTQTEIYEIDVVGSDVFLTGANIEPGAGEPGPPGPPGSGDVVGAGPGTVLHAVGATKFVHPSQGSAFGPGMQRWHIGLRAARAGTGSCLVLAIGDSEIEIGNAFNPLVQYMKAILQPADFQPDSTNLQSYQQFGGLAGSFGLWYTVTGTIASAPGAGHGLTGTAVDMNNGAVYTNNGSQHASGVRCDRYHIYHCAGGGTIDIVDNGVTVATGHSMTARGRYDSGPVTPGLHVIQITAHTSGTKPRVDGIDYFWGDHDTGIHAMMLGHSGETLQNIANNYPDFAAWLPTLQPHLFINEVGGNDWGAGRTAAQFYADYNTLINMELACVTTAIGVPPPSILQVQWNDVSNHGGWRALYLPRQLQLSEERGIPLVDMGDGDLTGTPIMPDLSAFPGGGPDPGGWTGDGLHWTALANEVASRAVLDCLYPSHAPLTPVSSGSVILADVVGAGALAALDEITNEFNAGNVVIPTSSGSMHYGDLFGTSLVTLVRGSETSPLYSQWGGATSVGPGGTAGPYVSLPSRQNFNAQTGATYTLVANDQWQRLTAGRATAQTWTIPPHSAVGFADGTRIVIDVIGAGPLTIAPGAGVTVTGDLVIAAGGSCEIVSTANDVWVVNAHRAQHTANTMPARIGGTDGPLADASIAGIRTFLGLGALALVDTITTQMGTDGTMTVTGGGKWVWGALFNAPLWNFLANSTDAQSTLAFWGKNVTGGPGGSTGPTAALFVNQYTASDLTPAGMNNQTANYAAVLGDAGKTITMNGSSLTLTIPANASVAFPIGTRLKVINLASTSLTIAVTSDNARNIGAGTLAQYKTADLIKIAATTWVFAYPS